MFKNYKLYLLVERVILNIITKGPMNVFIALCLRFSNNDVSMSGSAGVHNVKRMPRKWLSRELAATGQLCRVPVLRLNHNGHGKVGFTVCKGLVFLIDWNRARNWLQLLVSKEDALALLS